MRLGELPKNYRVSLPQIDGDEVLKHWACRWYDGPLSGIAFYRGNPCLFESRHDDEVRRRVDRQGQGWNDWYKPFVLVEMMEGQYQQLAREHELFRVQVGTHCDYDEIGKRLPVELRVIHPQSMRAEYYEAAKVKISFSDNQVVGWFEWLWDSVEQE